MSPMTASRSDCSRDPADEIPAVADDDDVMGEEASSPKFTEVLFERPNMLFCTVFEPCQHSFRRVTLWLEFTQPIFRQQPSSGKILY